MMQVIKITGSVFIFLLIHTTKFNVMKSFVLIALILGLFTISCKREQQPQPANIDSINTGDSMVSGTAQITPDSLDNTLPMDSTAYDVDSIKNSK
jgi:hypothetical protein